MKTKIEDAVDGDAESGPESQCASESRAGPQVLFCFANDKHDEPGADRQTEQAAAREQFKIVVVRFLRHERAGRVVIRGDADPKSAEARAVYWMRGEEAHRCAPDLIASRVVARRAGDG